jgi:hypothetical protein
MALIIVSNNLALEHLDKNLRLIEQKQLRKASVGVNNSAKLQDLDHGRPANSIVK